MRPWLLRLAACRSIRPARTAPVLWLWMLPAPRCSSLAASSVPALVAALAEALRLPAACTVPPARLSRVPERAMRRSPLPAARLPPLVSPALAMTPLLSRLRASMSVAPLEAMTPPAPLRTSSVLALGLAVACGSRIDSVVVLESRPPLLSRVPLAVMSRPSWASRAPSRLSRPRTLRLTLWA